MSKPDEQPVFKILNQTPLFEGKIFGLKSQEVSFSEAGSEVRLNFEIAERAPGVRLIIPREDKILLTKEFRPELGGWDYRLPGGKVFDSYQEFQAKSGDLDEHIKMAVLREAREEVGVLPTDFSVLHIDKLGATVVWDLYYVVVNKFDEDVNGVNLEVGEKIETHRISVSRVREMCLSGEIHESRSALVLLKYLK